MLQESSVAAVTISTNVASWNDPRTALQTWRSGVFNGSQN